MNQHQKINYIELPARDIAATKAFFETVFGWRFEDYGPNYAAFFEADGLDGGFYKSELAATTESGSALVIFYSAALEQTQAKIEAAGGKIIRPVFAFPGGRRFHFADPGGNEFAVWSEIAAG
ncbi:MAG: VOC family protein [Anaerolineae bacterium]